nr:hypothetical protein [Mucilaginibacter sp. FT3.2]MBB6230821.1 hypothetical protein [Mucilaginibacter sp. FT3.2]
MVIKKENIQLRTISSVTLYLAAGVAVTPLYYKKATILSSKGF